MPLKTNQNFQIFNTIDVSSIQNVMLLSHSPSDFPPANDSKLFIPRPFIVAIWDASENNKQSGKQWLLSLIIKWLNTGVFNRIFWEISCSIHRFSLTAYGREKFTITFPTFCKIVRHSLLGLMFLKCWGSENFGLLKC